jgi:hypothetical protein
MTLSVKMASLVERFTSRLQALLADSETVLAAKPERVIALHMPVGDSAEANTVAEARLDAALRTNEDAPMLPSMMLGHGATLDDGEDTIHGEATHMLKRLLAIYGKRAAHLPWPETLPESLTAAQAFEVVRQDLPELARELAEEVEALAALFVSEDALRGAVLARKSLVDGWLLPDGWLVPGVRSHSGWSALTFIQDAEGAVRHGKNWRGGRFTWNRPHPLVTPPDVAYTDALRWAQKTLARAVGKKAAAGALDENTAGDGTVPHPFVLPADEHGVARALWPSHVAVLFRAWREVDHDRRRPALAIDAGKVNHGLLMGWSQVASEREIRCRSTGEGFVELLLPGQSQISLGVPEEAHERLISEIRHLRSPNGLRTYATLLHLLSIRGQRQGFVRWTLEEHLDVQGAPKKERREARLRTEAQEVELLTKIELAVRDSSGQVRERRPLFLVGSRFERLQGSRWKLDGMELQVNPLIWSGVRDPKTGRLGTNYGLGAEGLPRLNPRTHPAALALGIILPIRFRLALNEGRDYHDLSGENVLRYAGLPYSSRDPGRTWQALSDDLDELTRLGGVRRWEWKGDGKPSLANVLRFYMSEGHRDRMALGVRPMELPAARPVTGEELKAWRKAGKMTQAKAAEVLKVGLRTVKRAEAAPGEALGPALRDALRVALGRVRSGASTATEAKSGGAAS